MSSRYENEIITRSAPRWAWDQIDETLALDSIGKGYSALERAEIATAHQAMMRASAAVEINDLAKPDFSEPLGTRAHIPPEDAA